MSMVLRCKGLFGFGVFDLRKIFSRTAPVNSVAVSSGVWCGGGWASKDGRGRAVAVSFRLSSFFVLCFVL